MTTIKIVGGAADRCPYCESGDPPKNGEHLIPLGNKPLVYRAMKCTQPKQINK